MLLQIINQLRAKDGGPIYIETNFDRWIVEPWNAVSAALFMAMVGYWVWKIVRYPERQQFIKYHLPILAVGGVGGTIYHAFRYSQVFLVMDWFPILLLCLSTSTYFLYKMLGKWTPAIGIVFGAFLIQGIIFRFFPPRMAINVNYAFMAGLIVLPVLIYAYRANFDRAHWVGLSIASFAIALACRIADQFSVTADILPMGTHFLWHVFGALACNFMIKYIFEINRFPSQQFSS